MSETQVRELLDELAPTYDDRAGNWAAVEAGARGRPTRGARWWLPRLGAVAAATVAVSAVVLAWPDDPRNGGVLDRALAAIGNGPVLHAVLRGEWGGTLVDLDTGRRSPVHGENEVWYDTDAGRVHTVLRLGDEVQDDEVSEPKQPPRELAALGREYRQALESGAARIAEETTIDGQRAVWITIHSELLPDVADGKDHEWAQQVAVSRRTFEPIALRETRDGAPGPGTFQRVLKLEFLPRNDADLDGPNRSLEGTAMKQGREEIPLARVPSVLGHRALWLGEDYRGLPLARAYREITATGRFRKVRLTGKRAEEAAACSKRPDAHRDCFRALRLHSLEVRPDGVFTTVGPIVWGEERSAAVLFYGAVGDDESTYRKDEIPLYDRPYVTLAEATDRASLADGRLGYAPPDGAVFLGAGGRTGLVRRDGVYVWIQAADADAVLAAARALEPM